MAPKPAPQIPLPPSMPRAKNPHPGLPDQPRSKRSTEVVQAEKEKKANEKLEKERRREQAIKDAADYQQTSQAQHQEQMANALRPPATALEKVPRPQRTTAAAAAAKSGAEKAALEGLEVVSTASDNEFVPGKDGEDDSASDEDMLDPSDEEIKKPAKKNQKKGKKSSLRADVEAVHGKSIPSSGNTKRKAEAAASRGRKDQKKQKKIATGVYTNWEERSGRGNDEDFDMYVDDPDVLVPSVNDSDRRSRSASSGVSVQSRTSKPPISDEEGEISVPPFSDNEGEGEERVSMAGRAAKAEDLKQYYGGGSKAKGSKVRSLAKVVPTTSVASFIPPSTTKKLVAARLKREDVRQSHLPSHLQNAFLDIFAPRLIELAGTLVPWDSITDDHISVLWAKVFPAEPRIVERSEMEVIVRKLSNDQISTWRNKFATIALNTLRDIVFPQLPENTTATRSNWCTWILGQSDDNQPPFYYREYTETESEDATGAEGPKITRQGPFQSTLISEVFGNAHLAAIATIPLSERNPKRPIAALTYATQCRGRLFSYKLGRPSRPNRRESQAHTNDKDPVKLKLFIEKIKKDDLQAWFKAEHIQLTLDKGKRNKNELKKLIKDNVSLIHDAGFKELSSLADQVKSAKAATKARKKAAA